jgi:hypothetical protein
MSIRARPARAEPTMMKTVPSGMVEVWRKGFWATFCGMMTWYVGTLAGFWVRVGRPVLRVGSAAEEVRAGRAAVDEEERLGRSADDDVCSFDDDVESVLSVVFVFCAADVV